MCACASQNVCALAQDTQAKANRFSERSCWLLPGCGFSSIRPAYPIRNSFIGHYNIWINNASPRRMRSRQWMVCRGVCDGCVYVRVTTAARSLFRPGDPTSHKTHILTRRPKWPPVTSPATTRRTGLRQRPTYTHSVFTVTGHADHCLG